MPKGPYQKLLEQPGATPQDWRAQRVELIRQIQAKRGRPLVVYATALVAPPPVPAYMHPDDLLPFSEVLESVSGKQVDVLLETPGGLAEVAVEIVNLLRPRFDDVAFLIPHMAMSAGTILVMSGDDILMDYRSSVGPIDPQFAGLDGRPQAAQAIIEGIKTISEKVKANNGQMDPVWIPILRNVDPGKYQAAINASELSTRLVTQWLSTYKFKNWTEHSSTKKAVVPEDRQQRARGIAEKLCSHQEWLSHGRPIKIGDLVAMKLKVTDYGEDPELQSLIWSLWVNLHHFMGSTNIYKAFESETVELWKLAAVAPSTPRPVPLPDVGGKAVVDVKCLKCNTENKVQANFGKPQPLDAGAVAFPTSLQLPCRGCGNLMNLSGLKAQIEAQVKQPLLL